MKYFEIRKKYKELPPQERLEFEVKTNVVNIIPIFIFFVGCIFYYSSISNSVQEFKLMVSLGFIVTVGFLQYENHRCKKMFLGEE